MPRSLRPREETAAELRAGAQALSALASREELDVTELGKALARVANGVAALFREAGVPSVRMAAVVRALDLRTPKGELERFTGR